MRQNAKTKSPGKISKTTGGRKSSNRSTVKGEQQTTKSNGKKSSEKSNGQKASLLEQLFTNQLKDIYYAEQLLLKTLPKMADACTTEELEDAFREHLQQTERHVKRLEKVFQIIGKKPEGKKCDAMEGLVKEGEHMIKETKEGTMTRDAGLIIAAQKVEHYEIATYGSLVQLAITMGLHRASDVLDKTLVEEGNTDGKLTHIAETYINIEADEEGPYSWEMKGGEENEEEDEEELETEGAQPGSYSM